MWKKKVGIFDFIIIMLRLTVGACERVTVVVQYVVVLVSSVTKTIK